ncbi:hypothetical protein CLOSTHATH_06046 [Hungatella hathewayi DSM 13479]|uniref:Uncharacterized protein n=1 Tax=Hungatella hathewayi DSM 13479 TaxID=566550 RepID=D3AQZ0_9FIRM|nr:hypothetical protein CLOSTHATH_06046 [Hungatella hathewayi DSM 13479]
MVSDSVTGGRTCYFLKYTCNRLHYTRCPKIRTGHLMKIICKIIIFVYNEV